MSISSALISAGATVVVGLMTLIGVVITNNKSKRDIGHKLETAQAVTDTKLEELTREVRMHNNFAEKIPVMQEQIKVVNHRLKDLEQYHKQN